MRFQTKKNTFWIFLFLFLPIISLGCKQTNSHEPKSEVIESKIEPIKDSSYVDPLTKAFITEYKEIPIIGQYSGFVLIGDSIFDNGESENLQNANIRILKDGLFMGFLVMLDNNGKLKQECDKQNNKYLLNKRAYYIFNETYSKVCVVYQARYNEKVNVIETPFDIYSIEGDCFLLLSNGVFDGEEFTGKEIKRAFQMRK